MCFYVNTFCSVSCFCFIAVIIAMTQRDVVVKLTLVIIHSEFESIIIINICYSNTMMIHFYDYCSL